MRQNICGDYVGDNLCQSLGDLISIKKRKNNFDFIRFIAATMVIFSHAFPLSGNNQNKPLYWLTNGQMSFGDLGVAIFFIISGFLISQSYDNSKNIILFTKSRVLRIFPGLIACVFLSAFIIGPIATNLSLRDYFSNSQTYQYLKAIFLYPMQWNLPGVFDGNAYKSSVNGSLWTIPFEFMFYMIVGFLGLSGLLKFKKVVLALFFLNFYLFIFVKSIFPDGGGHIIGLGLPLDTAVELFSYFSVGMLLYSYRNSIKMDKHIAMFSVMLLFLSIYYGGLKALFVLFGSYLIMYFAFNQNVELSGFSRHGDFSYGLYVYAFPVQQLVSYYHGGQMGSIRNFLISFLVTLLLAVASWHLIESRFLKLKKVKLINSVIPNFNKGNINEYLCKISNKYNGLLENVLRVGWRRFSLVFILFVVFFVYYNESPSNVVFPYRKSNSIFHGGWLPQSETERYRWVAGSVSIDMAQPPKTKKLIIDGFIPQGFIEINKMDVFIDNQKLTEINVKENQSISVISNIVENKGKLSKKISVRMDFDYIHKPRPEDVDKREMSALISKICLE